MVLKRVTLTLVCALALCLLGLATSGGAVQAAEEPATISAQVLHSMNAYAQGGSYPLIIKFTLRPGFHINSQHPAEPDLYPSSLSWQAAPGIALGPDLFPAPRTYQPAFATAPMQVHDGVFSLRTTLKVAKDAAPGARTVTAKLEFQACDDQACLMPESLVVPVSFTVAPAGRPGKRLNPEAFK